MAMNDLEDFLDMKRKVEVLKRDKDRAEGALAQVKEQLKKSLGTDDLTEGKKLLSRMEKSLTRLEQEFHQALKTFKVKWEGQLGDDDG